MARTTRELAPLQHADLVCCVSQEVSDDVIARGLPAERGLITPCTADSQCLGPDILGDACRSKVGVDGQFVVGWVGSFRPFHSLDLLLDPVACALPQVKRIHLLLVGDGPTRIERRAADLGLPATFAGAVPHEQVPSFVAAMDVAMIAPQIGEMGRELQHLQHAWLYTPGDVSGSARGLIELAENQSLREALAAAGRARYLANGTMDSQLTNVVNQLEYLFGAHTSDSTSGSRHAH